MMLCQISIVLLLVLPLNFLNCLKTKCKKKEFSRSLIDRNIDENPIIGLEKPSGYLCRSYLSKFRLPGFPFEFPPIESNFDKKYLIFPADTAANFQKSKKRCDFLGGRLLDIDNAFEMQILSCAIASPSYISSWNEEVGPFTDKKCIKLFPKGYMIGNLSIHFILVSHDCEERLGSICQLKSNIKIL